MYIDSAYIFLVLPAIIFSVWAQTKVTSTFRRYSALPVKRQITGRETAEMILRANGINDVTVERASGNLTDHFDPRKKVIRLSESVYDSYSVAALGVAAHETGHAIQYAKGYIPIKLRNFVLPAAQFGSYAAFPLVILGLFMSLPSMVDFGIVLFAAVVLFQFVTLPVEFNASSRAIKTLDEMSILDEGELSCSKKVLSAAAMTYVAAAAVALANLLRLLSIAGRRRD